MQQRSLLLLGLLLALILGDVASAGAAQTVWSGLVIANNVAQPDPIPSAMLEDLMQRRVFFSPSAAETVSGDRVVDEPAGNAVAPSAEVIAPAVAPAARLAPDSPIAPGEPLASLAPVAPADAPGHAIDSAPETGAGDKADKS